MAEAASHPKANFIDTETIGLVQRVLGRHGRAIPVPHLSTVDKWPNTDGALDIQNRAGKIVGTIGVQVKTLPSNHNLKFECPVSFLLYCMAVPCILLGVDTQADTIYWLYFDGPILKNAGLEKYKSSKTVTFNKKQSFDLNRDDYLDAWEKIVRKNIARLNEYDDVKALNEQLLQKTNKTLGLTDEKFIRIHEFLDELNKGLEYDFPTVRKFFYPSVWKIGMAYAHYSNSRLDYMLYGISKDKNDTQIKQLDEHLVDEMREIGLGFRGYGTSNPLAENPAHHARDVLSHDVMRLVERKLLNHTGNALLAREFIFAFIDKFHVQLGLPEKDLYKISEIEFGFYEYLPRWIEQAYGFMLRVERNNIRDRIQRKGYFDPDVLGELRPEEQEEIHKSVLEGLKRGTGPVRMANTQLDLGVFEEFFKYMRDNNQSIERVYAKPDYSRLKNSSLIFNIYDRKTLRANLKIVFDNIQEVYATIIENNFPTLNNELAMLKPSNRAEVGFDLKDSYQNAGPSYTIYYLTPKSLDQSFRIVSEKRLQHLKNQVWSKDTWSANGGEMIATEGDSLRFMFNSTPLLDLTYEFLTKRLNKYFDT
ncbi:MAG TPA: hypothetical protein VFI74_05275 [Candidatus Saccharimonadales bacterium]|nr:hypothetical protein [Candidatus Saccharimonadales bacterium]